MFSPCFKKQKFVPHLYVPRKFHMTSEKITQKIEKFKIPEIWYSGVLKEVLLDSSNFKSDS